VFLAASCLIHALFFQPVGAKSALPYEVTFPVRVSFLKKGAPKDQVYAVLGVSDDWRVMSWTPIKLWQFQFQWFFIDPEHNLMVKFRRNATGDWVFESALLQSRKKPENPKSP